ncbi:MAG: HDOD domain-containing protein [Bdellovibrionales bacterium]|nr:HDOD domain-containing protein [Bdellovibrionales bacterium]
MAAEVLSQDYIVSKLDELPTLPTVVYELSRVINDPMSSTAEVERIMSSDQSLTTKVLKLVNSAYYAIPGGVSNLSRAIAFIGFDTVNQLVLSSSILKALEIKGPVHFDVNEFWKHSLGVAIAAETIAEFTRHPNPPDLFTSGLVHDMGKIALYVVHEEGMMSIIKNAEEKKISYYESEGQLELPRHTTLGYLLAQKWILPTQIMAVIKYHHQKDPQLRGGLSSDLNNCVDIVYLANLLIHALKFGNSGHQVILGAPKEVLGRLTIDPDKGFKKLLLDIKSNLDAAHELIRLLIGE